MFIAPHAKHQQKKSKIHARLQQKKISDKKLMESSL